MSDIPYKGRKRAFLLRQQRGLCFYCGKPMVRPTTANQRNPRRATLDHVRPVSAGGSDEIDNLVAACHDCNHRKADARLADGFESKEALAAAFSNPYPTVALAILYGWGPWGRPASGAKRGTG